MKKISLLLVASLFLGLGAMSQAVTHTIINKSDHPIYGLTYYRGRVDWLKSCRPDEGVILPGESLTSRAGGCLLEFVQIQDGNKVIKRKVANASGNIAAEVGAALAVGIIVAPFVVVAAGITGDATVISGSDFSGMAPTKASISELVVYAGIDTVWQYDGISLSPIKGVKVYEAGKNY